MQSVGCCIDCQSASVILAVVYIQVTKPLVAKRFVTLGYEEQRMKCIFRHPQCLQRNQVGKGNKSSDFD